MAATPQAYQKPGANQAPNHVHRGERLGIRRAIETVKDRVSCLDVADYHAAGQGGAWKRLGADKWTRRCILPGHEDRTPSFVVYVGSDSFYCFGCGRGGDAITLEKLCGEHAETWTVVVELARRYDVELPRRPERWHAWRDEKVRRIDRLRDVFAASYQRKMFRLLGSYLAGIEDPREREEEARAIWGDLRTVALMCAEYRVARRGDPA